MFRAQCKRLRQEAKDKVRFYLIYWKEEEGVSVHSEDEIKFVEDDREGAPCTVMFGKIAYLGAVACRGSKSEMLAKENDFLKGIYLPFHEQTTKETTVPKKNKKRKLIGNGGSKECRVSKKEATKGKVKKKDVAKLDAKQNKEKKNETLKSKQKILAHGSGAESSDSDHSDDERDLATPPILSIPSTSPIPSIPLTSPIPSIPSTSPIPSIPSTSPIPSIPSTSPIPSIPSTSPIPCIPSTPPVPNNLPTPPIPATPLQSNKTTTTALKPQNNLKVTIPINTTATTMPSTPTTSSSSQNIPTRSQDDGDQYDYDQYYNYGDYYNNEYIIDHDNGLEYDDDMASSSFSTNLTDSFEISQRSEDNIQYDDSKLRTQLKKVLQCQRHILYRLQNLESRYLKIQTYPMEVITIENDDEKSLPRKYGPQEVRKVFSEVNSSQLSIKKSTKVATISTYKENNALPDIDYSTLSSPDSVVEKYPSLLKPSRIPTLALKLAKEAYFGPEVMKHCTVKGNSGFYALPEEELASLKKYILKLALPRYVSNRYEFEQLWKECTNSIGQGCKHSR